MDMSSYSQGYSIGYNFGYDLGYNAGLADGKMSTDESTAEDSLETVELTEVPTLVSENPYSFMTDYIASPKFTTVIVSLTLCVIIIALFSVFCDNYIDY